MSRLVRLLAAAGSGYAIGSIPVGVLVGRLTRGVDVRDHGSGSMGATNVLRTAGVKPAAATFVLDVAKGAAAARAGAITGGSRMGASIGGIGAVVGHSWPAFARFRGGKSVATAFGALIVVSPPEAGWAMVGGLSALAATRRVSMCSLAGVAASTLAGAVRALRSRGAAPIVFSAPTAIVIVMRHRENIDRLRRGVEPTIRFGGRHADGGESTNS